jgi:hypothetical protein
MWFKMNAFSILLCPVVYVVWLVLVCKSMLDKNLGFYYPQ